MLKKCPFCGSEAKVDGFGSVECSNIMSCAASDLAMHYANWNRRPIEDALQAKLDQATEDMAKYLNIVVDLQAANDRLAEALERITYHGGMMEWMEMNAPEVRQEIESALAEITDIEFSVFQKYSHILASLKDLLKVDSYDDLFQAVEALQTEKGRHKMNDVLDPEYLSSLTTDELLLYIAEKVKVDRGEFEATLAKQREIMTEKDGEIEDLSDSINILLKKANFQLAEKDAEIERLNEEIERLSGTNISLLTEREAQAGEIRCLKAELENEQNGHKLVESKQAEEIKKLKEMNKFMETHHGAYDRKEAGQ